MRHIRFLAGCASIVALMSCTAAFAQEAQSDSSIADQAGDSGDIVVTATRSQTLASKTPVALTAISGEGLRDAGVTNPTTLGEQVPNLSIDRGDGLQITIRGVTSADGTEKGDPSAAFIMDGIYIARSQAQEVSFVRRRNIWRKFGVSVTEIGPRLGLGFRRRACGVASGDVRWSAS